jgi:hypothetical protein
MLIHAMTFLLSAKDTIGAVVTVLPEQIFIQFVNNSVFVKALLNIAGASTFVTA